MINDKQLNVEMNLKIDFYVEKYFKLLELIPEYNKTDTLVYDKFPKITLYKYCDMYYVENVQQQHKIYIENIHLSGYIIENLIIKYIHMFFQKFHQIIDKIIHNKTPQYLNVKGSIKKCYIISNEHIIENGDKVSLSNLIWDKIDTQTNFLDLFTNKYVEERKIKKYITSYMFNKYFSFEIIKLPDLYKLIEELKEKIKQMEDKKNYIGIKPCNNIVQIGTLDYDGKPSNNIVENNDIEYCQIETNYIKR